MKNFNHGCLILTQPYLFGSEKNHPYLLSIVLATRCGHVHGHGQEGWGLHGEREDYNRNQIHIDMFMTPH